MVAACNRLVGSVVVLGGDAAVICFVFLPLVPISKIQKIGVVSTG